jgi:hypothetical protein
VVCFHFVMEWAPMLGPGGEVLQAALRKVPIETGAAGRARGLLVQGVVLSVYRYGTPLRTGEDPNGVHCDVLLYGAVRGKLEKVLVPDALGGVQSGQIGGIRATTRNLGGVPLNVDHDNPADFDGTHVVVGFVDDDLSLPIILALLPHPKGDIGHAENAPLGERLHIREADGDPLLTKWNGAVYGQDANGDHVLDLRRAHRGDLAADGTEPAPATDGSRGNYRIMLPEGARLTVEIDGQNALTVDRSGAQARVQIGDGLFHAAIAEHLEALWAQMVSYIESARVITPFGNSSAIVAASGTAPAYDSAVTSTKLSLPDT